MLAPEERLKAAGLLWGEEAVAVLERSGRIRVDDESAEVGPLDAIRVAPESTPSSRRGRTGADS